jgi:hypothetical protein
VCDEALTKAISKLRKAFGKKGADPGFIQTIPKKGYCLNASVSPAADDHGTSSPVWRSLIPWLAMAAAAVTLVTSQVVGTVGVECLQEEPDKWHGVAGKRSPQPCDPPKQESPQARAPALGCECARLLSGPLQAMNGKQVLSVIAPLSFL